MGITNDRRNDGGSGGSSSISASDFAFPTFGGCHSIGDFWGILFSAAICFFCYALFSTGKAIVEIKNNKDVAFNMLKLVAVAAVGITAFFTKGMILTALAALTGLAVSNPLVLVALVAATVFAGALVTLLFDFSRFLCKRCISSNGAADVGTDGCYTDLPKSESSAAMKYRRGERLSRGGQHRRGDYHSSHQNNGPRGGGCYGYGTGAREHQHLHDQERPSRRQQLGGCYR